MSGNANLYAVFKRCFPADPETMLLSTDEGAVVSYRDADEASARMASVLLARGAQPGDRVTVQVDKSIENLFLYLACLRAGLVYQPLNTAYTAAELAYFIRNAEPSVVVCATAALAAVESVLANTSADRGRENALLTLDADGGGSLMRETAAADSQAEPVHCEGSEMAALLYSSGTTGQPKGIMLSHDNLRVNALALVDAWGFSPQDHLLHALPIYHVHGLFVALGCVLMSGASMRWQSRFSAAQVRKALPDCTVMMGVPTYYTRLLADPRFDASCTANMRLFISGSAPLLHETFFAFEARCGHTILERYGMTETGMNASNPLLGERRAGTVGMPLPGVSLRIVDEEGCELPRGETGNLQVKGANVFSAYWRMPEKTAEDFTRDGFFNTGDKATIDQDGYLAIVGRAKDMIISGGLNVYPKEIELVIDAMHDVLESAVIGVADADFGEAVLAVIVAKEPQDATDEPTPALTPQAVIEHCRESLAGFKLPKRVEFIDALPRNAMGKVQKNLLRERYANTELR